MKRLILVLAVIGLLAAAGAAYAFLRPTAEASQPIEAIPLTASTATTAARPTATAAPTTATTAAPEATATEASAEAAAPPSTGAVLFQIDQTQSSARFIIDEVLRGQPKTVVGETDQVAAQIEIDRANPANSRIGVIQINARTLATDNDMRNRAIKNQILMTDQYEFITFTPSTLEGMPASVAVGTPFTFTVSGDLTIRDVTRPATFTVTVTPVSETQINGLATTTVLYPDFAISVPEVPSVTGLQEQVILELEFVALPVP